MLMAMFSQLIVSFVSNFELNFERRVIQLSDYENPITVMPNKNDITGKVLGVYDEFETLANNMSIAVNQYPNVSFGLLEEGRDDIGFQMNHFLFSSVCRFLSNNEIHAITKYIKIADFLGVPEAIKFELV